jgi:hypothetical protein
MKKIIVVLLLSFGFINLASANSNNADIQTFNNLDSLEKVEKENSKAEDNTKKEMGLIVNLIKLGVYLFILYLFIIGFGLDGNGMKWQKLLLAVGMSFLYTLHEKIFKYLLSFLNL